jgi:putative Mg2+ transporter-C (MgtC) family protein
LEIACGLAVTLPTITSTAIVRILLAGLLGSGVGWERERHGREAGLRTHMLLCLGCALIMLVSLYIPEVFSQETSAGVVRADPGRIASTAISGLGFLGAGAIIVLGARIRGLTTAASIWVTAAIGLSVGAGYIWPALFTWAVAMFGLLVMGRWEQAMTYRDRYIHLLLTFSGKQKRMDRIQELLDQHDLKALHSTADHVEGEMLYHLVLRHRTEIDFEELTLDMTDELEPYGLLRIEWRQGPPEGVTSSGGSSA